MPGLSHERGAYAPGGDGMNMVFCVMLLCGVVFAAWTGTLSAAQEALLGGAGEAVTLCLSLAGAYAFFGGMLEVLRQSGAADALSRAMRRPLSRLIPFAPGEERALGEICVNLSCNMLGMGNHVVKSELDFIGKRFEPM